MLTTPVPQPPTSRRRLKRAYLHFVHPLWIIPHYYKGTNYGYEINYNFYFLCFYLQLCFWPKPGTLPKGYTGNEHEDLPF